MDSFVINAIIGFWLVLFGAMAIFPFLIESKPARRTPLVLEDDRVISIQPVAMPQTPRTPLTPITIPAPDHGHREAA